VPASVESKSLCLQARLFARRRRSPTACATGLATVRLTSIDWSGGEIKWYIQAPGDAVPPGTAVERPILTTGFPDVLRGFSSSLSAAATRFRGRNI